MKKKDLFNIAINLVVTIALTVIYIFTNLSSKVDNIFEKLIVLSLISLYLLSSKVVYDRIKNNKNYLSILNKSSIIYSLASVIYILAFIINNQIVAFVISGLFLSIFFMYFVTFTAIVIKMVNEKQNKLLMKISIILGVILVLAFGFVFLSKATITGSLNDVTVSFFLLAFVSSLMLLLIIGLTYLIKYLVLNK